MIENGTIKYETTTTVEASVNNYDYSGAMIYIIIVLLWYSVGIIFMLGMQMKARSEIVEDAARRRTKLLIRNLRDQTNTKEILEELVDKQKRDKLWDIYLDKTNDKKDKLTRAEHVRIRHIEKQLENINRNRRLTNETLFPTADQIGYYRSRSDSHDYLHKFPAPERFSEFRRQSSFDQQRIDCLKALSDQSKAQQQMPWTARKSMILRHFRRHPKKLLVTIPQEPVSPNSDTNIISTRQQPMDAPPRSPSESNLERVSTFDDKHNPYLTYFCSANTRPTILSPDIFLASSEHSVK